MTEKNCEIDGVLEMDKKLLYYAGMASGLAYLLGDIIGGIITPGYSFISNAVSELSQSGADNRPLMVPFLFIHAVLLILFGYAIMVHHPYKKSKSVFFGGLLISVVGISHSLSGTIFPQDPVGDPATFPGTMHLILVGITVILIFLLLPMMGQGLYVLKKWVTFRAFSLICLPIMIILGALTPFMIEIGMMGVAERIVGYTFYLWSFVLAYLLIKEQPEKVENDDEIQSRINGER
jgi:hypothetical membrane protein